MKLLPLIILCFIMTMACCTSKHADSTLSTCQTIVTDSIEEVPIDTSIVKSDNEDFIAFIKRFHTDTTFQQQRLCDVIHGYNNALDSTFYDCEDTTTIYENYIWSNDEINTYLSGLNMAVTDPASQYTRTIVLLSDSTIAEDIYHPSGVLYRLTFEIRKHNWVMSRFSDHWYD